MKRAFVVWSLSLATSCLSERPRPAPPTIALTLDKTTVESRDPPDTLVVSVRVEDADGIDSAWAQLGGTPPVGADGLLEPVLEEFFRLPVESGLPQGRVLPVQVRARDVAGFQSQRDTTVRVGP